MNEDDDDKTRVQTHPAVHAGANKPAVISRNGLPSGYVLGSFEIESVIGEGGFSIVYLARDRQLDRQTALKEYMPGSLAVRLADLGIAAKSERVREAFEAGLRSFVNEARVLAHFDHPALAKVFRFWEERGTAYMAMPYYEGVNLKQVLQRADAPPAETWLHWIFGPLLDAIELLHEENYFHRDIAPDNIMILRGGTPLLLDFGAARHVIGDMTQELTAILKPGYAPIEQYADTVAARQGPWTDIYAIAAVLYRAVTGRVPSASVGRLMSDDLPPVADAARRSYSAQLLAGIQAGLAIKPQDRPQSIAEFRRLLGYQSVPSPFAPTAMPDADAPPLQPAPAPVQPVSAAKERPAVSVQTHTGATSPASRQTSAPTPPSRQTSAPTLPSRHTSAPSLPSRLTSAPTPPSRHDEKTLPAAVPRIRWRAVLSGCVIISAIAGAWFAFRPDDARLTPDKPVLPPISGEKAAPALPSVLPQTVPPPTPEPIPKMPPNEPSFAGPQPQPSGPVAPSVTMSEPAATKSPPARAKSPTRSVPAARAKTAAERSCVELLEQLSLDQDTPELREKLQSLRCLGSQ
jgi:serine/threonine protein kinase